MSLTGEMDYLLRVVVSDMDHYSHFVMNTLLRHPSVQDCKRVLSSTGSRPPPSCPYDVVGVSFRK